MKMSFLAKFNKKGFSSYFLIALIIFFLDFWLIFNPLRNVFAWALRPLRGSTYYLLGQIDFEDIFLSKRLKQLKDENWELRKRMVETTGDRVRIQLLHRENERLKTLIDFFPKETSLIPAKVLGRRDNYLIINKGEEDGVIVGQTVVEGQHLVGKIVAVYDHESRVVKLGSASLDLPVLVFSDQQECFKEPLSCQKGRGIIVGETVKEILREEEVLAGDLVALLDEPTGILVGRIREVRESQDELYKQAQIEKLIDFNRLIEVFLIVEE